MSRFTTETTIRVYDDQEGGYIEIGPDPDGHGQIHVVAGNDRFGACDMFLEPEMAAVFADALSQMALQASQKREEESRAHANPR